MHLSEFTKLSDYALIANEISEVLRQLEQIWKDVLGGIPKRQVGAKLMPASTR